MGQLLISKGADINATDIIYQRIIIIFLIRIIYNKLRKLNQKNLTPLHIAAKNNAPELGESMILKGAYLNVKDIHYQNIKIVLMLI